MRILLTGFNPFGAVSINPSEQVVRRIAARARRRGDEDLVAEILPTEFAAAGKKIRALIRSIRPAAVLCLGAAVSRQSIGLERVALNLDDDPSPDNSGRTRAARPIVPGGPALYWSTLPLQRMLEALQKDRIRAAISNHAGTYVCNHAFYVARHAVERSRRRVPCGLIHVPGIRGAGKGSKAEGMALSTMIAAVERCIGVLRKPAASKSLLAH